VNCSAALTTEYKLSLDTSLARSIQNPTSDIGTET